MVPGLSIFLSASYGFLGSHSCSDAFHRPCPIYTACADLVAIQLWLEFILVFLSRAHEFYCSPYTSADERGGFTTTNCEDTTLCVRSLPHLKALIDDDAAAAAS